MIFYGGCEVRFSNYTLTNNTISDINTRSAKKHHCVEPNFDDKVLQPFYDEVKYMNHDQYGGDQYIKFYDKDFHHVATFSTDEPNNPKAYYPKG